MNPAMTTTAFELDGYRIVKNFGVVRGIIVRSRSIFGTIGAGLQTLVGGNITILTDPCAIDDYLRHDGHGSLRHANDRTGRGGLRDRAHHGADSKRRGQLATYRARPA